jgi:aspartyl protease
MELKPDTRSALARLRSRTTLLMGLLPAVFTGCGRAGGPLESTPTHSAPPHSATSLTSADSVTATEPPAQVDLPSEHDNPIRGLELLRRRGQFEEFVNATLNAAAENADGEHGNSPDLQLLKTEALLAVGRDAEAEAAARSAATLALDQANTAMSSRALKLWATARFRQRKPLADSLATEILTRLPADDPDAQTLRFWSDSLGQRTPYEVVSASDAAPAEIQSARAASGTISAELNAIEAQANGVTMPLVFIDTGAQHTLMTTSAAQAAGVAIGPSDTILIGFSGLKARPGVLANLRLGSLSLHDVPVLVGNSAPLMTARGQMALGTDLMHHVRFTLDYPSRRVLAEPAESPRVVNQGQPRWEIPLWTFSQACLARGQLPDGATARVLIDTGDRAGTFVSSRWARRTFSPLALPNSTMVFKYKHRGLALDTMELGGYTLRDWPVVDRIPRELERLDLVDVLVGRDLLGKYQVTIDLGQRVLQLQGDSGASDRATPP